MRVNKTSAIMALKHYISIFPATFCLLVSSCTQPPTKQKISTPPVEIKEAKADQVISQQSEPDTLKGSLKSEARGNIGLANVKISYYSPAVRGRVVWGGLVPYDQVWVTGAHSATSLETDQKLVIGGKVIPAGKYALFTIPGKEDWTIIINKNSQQHLADNYSEKDDLVRVLAKPEVQQVNQERLRYEIFSNAKNTGQIVISWEKLKLTLLVKSE